MQIRKLASGRGWAWFSESWQIYKRDPLMWSIVSLVYVLLICAMSVVPLVGSLACMVFAPVLSVGLFLCAHSLAVDGKFDLGQLFEGFQEKRFKDVLLFGVVYSVFLTLLVIFIALVSGAAGFWLLGGAVPQVVEIAHKFSEGDYSALANTNIYLIMGLVFFATMFGLVGYALVWMATWLAVPIMVFQNQDLSSAMKQSFRISMANVWPVLVYGLSFFFWFFASSLTFGLGLFVFGPVVLLTQYVSYRDLVGPILREKAQ